MTGRREFILRAIAAPATPLLGSGRSRAEQSRSRAAARGYVAGYDHVALPVLNVQEMAGFYRRLGFRVEESATVMTVHFADSKINFHLPQLWRRDDFALRGKAARPGCGDLCFVWDGSHEALDAMLSRVGVHLVEGPVERVGGRRGGTAKATSVYIYDPDGNLLEFMIY